MSIIFKGGLSVANLVLSKPTVVEPVYPIVEGYILMSENLPAHPRAEQYGAFDTGETYTRDNITALMLSGMKEIYSDPDVSITFGPISKKSDFIYIPANRIDAGYTYDPDTDSTTFVAPYSKGMGFGFTMQALATITSPTMETPIVEMHNVHFISVGMYSEYVQILQLVGLIPVEEDGYISIPSVDPNDPTYNPDDDLPVYNTIDILVQPFGASEQPVTITQSVSGVATNVDIMYEWEANETLARYTDGDISFETSIPFKGTGAISRDGYYTGVYVSENPEEEIGTYNGEITINIGRFSQTVPLVYELVA